MDLRASDSEREQTTDSLRHAAAEGRLTVDELEERLSAAHAATTRGELERLTTDVVVPAEAGNPAPADSRLPVRPGDDGTERLIAIMGGSERSGHWKLARRVRVVNVMGGSDLDLNDAEFAADVVEMRVFCLWGGADIYVPEGLNIEVSEFNLMGGNDVRVGEARPDPGGPTLRLHLTAIMGGSTVKRGRKQSWSERRAERKRLSG